MQKFNNLLIVQYTIQTIIFHWAGQYSGLFRLIVGLKKKKKNIKYRNILKIMFRSQRLNCKYIDWIQIYRDGHVGHFCAFFANSAVLT